MLGRLGYSAVGALHLARLEGPQGFQRWAAIRIVDKERSADPAFTKEFFERAALGASLLHPNVAALFDVGETEGTVWLATEYLKGERVEEIISRIHLANTPISWDVAARIVADAAEGLFALHDHKRPDGTMVGLLHGDAAPHSVMVTYAGETKIKGAFEPHARGTLDQRKLPYAAPEQIWSEAVDGRADVFALGVILWELCAATRLFARASDDETRAMVEAGVVPSLCDEVPEFPPEIDSLVRRSLAHDKQDRFSSARELSRALEAALVGRGVLTRADDVGAYMKTLFADRYEERNAEIQEAAQVTEVFLKTKRRLAFPKASADTGGLVDLSVPDAEIESTVLSTSDELPTMLHNRSDLEGPDPDQTLEDADLATTVEKPPVQSARQKLPEPEVGAPEAITDEVEAAPDRTGSDLVTKDVPTRIRASFASMSGASTERRAPPVQRVSTPPPRTQSVPPRPHSIPPPPAWNETPPPPPAWNAPAPFRSAPPPMMVPPFIPAPQVLQLSEPPRGSAIFAGIAVAVVLFGGFLIAMQSHESGSSTPPLVVSVSPASAPVRATPPSTIAISPVPSSIPTIPDVKATDLPITTATTTKKPTPQPRVVVRAPMSNDPPKTGQLTVICTPACDQVMDGPKALGPTPIFKRSTTVGTHHLTLRGEDGAKKTVNVDVAEGETAVVKQAM